MLEKKNILLEDYQHCMLKGTDVHINKVQENR
jgi:hypothetical protein